MSLADPAVDGMTPLVRYAPKAAPDGWLTSQGKQPGPIADQWVPWNGVGEPPLSKHEKIMVRYRDGTESPKPRSPEEYIWRQGLGSADIIAYKLIGADA